MSREVFKKLAERQAQGVLFHSEMADYYKFLNLCDFWHIHHCQYMKESATYRDIKDFYISHCHKTLKTDIYSLGIIITPDEWTEKTTLDVDKDTLKVLLKKSLQKYLDWETETSNLYKEYADALFNEEYFEGYNFIRKLVDDVELEKTHITSLMIDLQAVDYDINAIKNFSYKMKW